jgi:hypothetical protein
MGNHTRRMIAALSMIVLSAMSGAAQTVRPQPDVLAKAVQEIENLDALRSSLAGTFEGKGTPADQSSLRFSGRGSPGYLLPVYP